MSSPGVTVELRPRAAPCHAASAWHSASALFVCTFEYGAEPAHPHAPAVERIEAALGISATPARALLGAVDLLWQDESRLHSIELRTGRGEWEPSPLPLPAGRAEAGSVRLGLAYDGNRVASVDVDVCVLWDVEHARLGLRFGNAEPERGRWVAIADTVFVWVDDPLELLEIRFADVQMLG